MVRAFQNNEGFGEEIMGEQTYKETELAGYDSLQSNNL